MKSTMELYGMTNGEVEALRNLSYGFAIETKITYAKIKYNMLCKELKQAYDTKNYDSVSHLNAHIVELAKAIEFNKRLLGELNYEV